MSIKTFAILFISHCRKHTVFRAFQEKCKARGTNILEALQSLKYNCGQDNEVNGI